jgi:hypothetical protein
VGGDGRLTYQLRSLPTEPRIFKRDPDASLSRRGNTLARGNAGKRINAYVSYVLPIRICASVLLGPSLKPPVYQVTRKPRLFYSSSEFPSCDFSS